jgi:hypothetical protein
MEQTAIEIGQPWAAGSSRKTRSDTQGRSIWARYLWALIQALKRWPHSNSSSRSRRTRSAAREESWNDAEMKPMRPADDMPSYHHITRRASRANHDLISHRGATHTTSPEIWKQNSMRLSYCPRPRRRRSWPLIVRVRHPVGNPKRKV